MDERDFVSAEIFLSKISPDLQPADDLTILSEQNIVWLGYWLKKNFFGKAKRKMIIDRIGKLALAKEEGYPRLNAIAIIFGNKLLSRREAKILLPLTESSLQKIVGSEKPLYELFDFYCSFGTRNKAIPTSYHRRFRKMAMALMIKNAAEIESPSELMGWLNYFRLPNDLKRTMVKRIKSLLQKGSGAERRKRLLAVLDGYLDEKFYYFPLISFLKQEAKKLIA
jgi:hypothetical protein